MLGRQRLPQHIFFVIRLELVNQTYSNDVISAYTECFSEVIFVKQVDFVINESRHIFVEVIGCTYINIFD
uniref:Uncharacterized protein n=1 Tax=Enterobacteria phage PA-2 TaxID=10738 RepID=Q38586_BPPA2|nr:ORF1 [Enterobacteria phage PA-2]